MSTMNPLKFVGGLVLEIGAVIAVLAILPGFGSSEPSLPLSSLAPAVPNQVFFNAESSRVLDNAPRRNPAPPAAWQNEFSPPPPREQQRFVEGMLDHNSQRALDATARLWNQGDRLLPPELRVRREPIIEPIETPRLLTPAALRELPRPSYYAPPSNYSAQRRPQLDDRY